MCLDVVYRGKQKKEALAKLPESGYYWKSVTLWDEEYWPPIWDNKPYKSGWNTTKKKYGYERYACAYHMFRYKDEAKQYGSYTDETVRCKVDKKDIINIGTQNIGFGDQGLVIVTTRFWCPKPK